MRYNSMLILALTAALPACATAAAQDAGSVPDVVRWMSKSAKNPELAPHSGVLSFDGASKKLSFNSGKQSFDVGYDAVRRIVIDMATHTRPRRNMIKQIGESRKTGSGELWMHVEAGAAGAKPSRYMLLIPETSATQVGDRAKEVFGDRVTVTDVRVGAITDGRTMPDYKSKHSFELADRKKHPAPELQPGKALIVVVCPPYADYKGGGLITAIGPKKKHKAGEFGSKQIKTYVDGKVVLVNQTGTYGWAQLDPGEYQIAARGSAFNATALQMKVEAGKAYYFLQEEKDLGMGPGYETQISQHSPELVTFKMDEAFFGVWSSKSK